MAMYPLLAGVQRRAVPGAWAQEPARRPYPRRGGGGLQPSPLTDRASHPPPPSAVAGRHRRREALTGHAARTAISAPLRTALVALALTGRTAERRAPYILAV